jgi:hypothetical protein
MKRQYVMAVLLLLGLGIVSTLAFSLGDLSASSVAAPVSIEQGETAEHLDEVHIYPYQSPDGMYLKMDLTAEASSYTFSISVEASSTPIDISGYTFSVKTDGDWDAPSTTWDADLGTVTMTVTGTFTTIKLRISDIDSDLYTTADKVLIFEQDWATA